MPELRFSCFKGEWEEIKLDNLTDKIGDGLHSTPKYVDDSHYYFINGNNLDSGKIIINENTKCVDKEEYEKYYIELNENTILLSINGTIGNLSFFNNEKVILGKSSAYINLKKDINKYFIYNLLQTERIKFYFNNELTGSTIKNLSLKSLKDTPIKIPSKLEQNKIALFLFSIDRKIELMEKKYNVLSMYHKSLLKALMKNHINDIKESKQLSLNHIVNYNSSNLSLNNLEGNSGSYPLFGADGFVKNIDFYEMDEEYIGIVKDGAGVGRISYNNKKTSVLGTMGYLTSNKDVNLKYVYYYLSMLNLSKYIVGSTIPHIYFKDYSKEKIYLPKITEQKRTVNLLDYINVLIENLSKEIIILKNFKKSLLSKMFC